MISLYQSYGLILAFAPHLTLENNYKTFLFIGNFLVDKHTIQTQSTTYITASLNANHGFVLVKYPVNKGWMSPSDVTK